jgi:GNAT superfamily N-acetyltransferase
MIEFSAAKDIPEAALRYLYEANGWSSVKNPTTLRLALANSHAIVTAWDALALVGLGSTLSDGHLVVYYSHLLVHPDYQRTGIGSAIAQRLMAQYEGFHQHVLIAAEGAVEFYGKHGFESGSGTAMWQAGFDP